MEKKEKKKKMKKKKMKMKMFWPRAPNLVSVGRPKTAPSAWIQEADGNQGGGGSL